jgi:transaldolase
MFKGLYGLAPAQRIQITVMSFTSLSAFRDHGRAVKDAVEKGNPGEILANLAKFHIDLNEVGEKLQQEGIESFASSFKKLLFALEEKSKAMRSH